MMTEPNTAQSIVDGQLAELQITSTEVTGDTYKEQHDAKIAALAAEEAALPTPKDKASLQAVQDIITKTERARTGIDKWRKAFKDQWKRIIDPVDSYIGTNKESGMQARLFEIQQRAEAKKKAYLDEQAKAQREAERLLEERYNERVGKLMAIGMAFEPNGNLTIRHGEETATATKEQIRFATDEQMAGAVQRAEIIAEKITDAIEAALHAKEAQEREEAEERERLRVQKEEQDAAAAKLKAEREALEKEKAEMKWQKCEVRASELETLGAVAQCGDTHGYSMEIADQCYRVIDLADMDEAQWADVKQKVRDAKLRAEQEAAERSRAEAERAEQAAKVEPVPNNPDPMDQADFLPVIDPKPEPVFETIAELTRPEPVPEFLRFGDAQLQQMQDDQVITEEEPYQQHPMMSDADIVAMRKTRTTISDTPEFAWQDGAMDVRDWYEERISSGHLVHAK